MLMESQELLSREKRDTIGLYETENSVTFNKVAHYTKDRFVGAKDGFVVCVVDCVIIFECVAIFVFKENAWYMSHGKRIMVAIPRQLSSVK